MKSVLLSVLLAQLWFSSAQAQTWLLTDEEWARPRQGQTLLQFPSLRAVVHHWMQAGSGFIVIKHPGADEGVIWAGELRDWLVALGIPSSALRLQRGSARGDALALEVTAE